MSGEPTSTGSGPRYAVAFGRAFTKVSSRIVTPLYFTTYPPP